MKKLGFIFLLMCVCGLGFTQTGHQIRGQIKGMTNKKILLGHYLGATQYVQKDTAIIGNDGRFVFQNTNSLPQGLYIVIQKGKGKILELIIDENQHFTFATDSADLIGAMQIKNSKENTIYYQYKKQIKSYDDEYVAIELQKTATNNLQTIQKFNEILKEQQRFTEQFIAENKGTFVAKMLKADAEITVPDNLSKSANAELLEKYYQKNYWNNFDFGDERLVRTPFFEKKLNKFLDEFIAPNADSLIKAADDLLDKVRKQNSKEFISYTIWRLTSRFETSKKERADEAYVHMAEKYYLGGIMPSVDSTVLGDIRKKVQNLKPLFVGQPMPNLVLSDTLRKKFALADIKSKFTLVFFFGSECGSCIKAAPILHDFYEKYKTKGLAILAVATSGSPDSWKNYINNAKLQEMYHGFDFSFAINYRVQFNVVGVPYVYLLDEHKKIIGKELSLDRIETIINEFHKDNK